MAFEQPLGKSTFKANADLSGKQFHIVKLTANNTVDVCSAATDRPVGILQNTPKAGEAAEVLWSGISKLKVGAGAAIAGGDPVGTDASGQGDTKVYGTDTTNFVVAECVEGAAAGNICTVLVNIPGHRAA